MKQFTILLADDHELVRAGISNALRDLENLTVVGEVGDGLSLFTALERLKPDCLMVDVSMPDFEPLTAIRHIRSNYPNLKILMISAHDDDVYVQGLLSAGVHGYHLKDQSLSDLKLAIQRVLAGEKWISSRLLSKLVNYQQAPAASLPALTSRQRDILSLLQEGCDNQTIARRMSLSVKTIENHLTRLYRQLSVSNRLAAVTYAREHPELLATPGRVAAHKQPTAPRPSSPIQKTIAILLVDDNMRYRRQLRRMVGKVCPQAMIYEAENINTAVNAAKNTTPKLIFVDVVLGEENGIHCTRRLKSVCPSSRVLLMSAYPDREFHRMGLEAGAIALLDKKDLDTAAMRQVIEDLVA
ncbi:response regulator [Anaerolineales bacterium HSG6]|nr:response regulator [Anaerolineales bacterium HSG6]MDM8532645.1 response regulator [Anaerolineales bacterium HSG25]